MRIQLKFYRIRYNFPRSPDDFRVATDEEAIVFARSIRDHDAGFEALELWHGDSRVRKISLEPQPEKTEEQILADRERARRAQVGARRLKEFTR